MLRYKTEIRPDLVALYNIRPGNGAGQFLQPGAHTGRSTTLITIYVKKGNLLTIVMLTMNKRQNNDSNSYNNNESAAANQPPCEYEHLSRAVLLIPSVHNIYCIDI